VSVTFRLVKVCLMLQMQLRVQWGVGSRVAQ
jgi:hypothetical protein